jgi:heptosyltransferase-2
MVRVTGDMRVALIKLGSLGDVVRTTCLLPGLRRLAPQLDLTWITQPDALPLIAGHPDVRRAVTVDDDQGGWREEEYDWVLSLDDDRIACRLASRFSAKRLSGGYEDECGERRYTRDVAGWFGMGVLRPRGEGGLPEANRLKRGNELTHGTILYRDLGLQGPVGRPSVVIPATSRERARRWLRKMGLGTRPLVALNTSAGSRWEFKSWGEGQTSALARRIADELDADVVLLGGPAESNRNQRIAREARHSRVLEAPTSLDLSTFAALIAECTLLVSSDSLAMHLACAASVPVIAFFGPTSDGEIDLHDSGEKVVTPLECRRCYLQTCNVRPHCMESITVERLFEAIVRWSPRSSRSVSLP